MVEQSNEKIADPEEKLKHFLSTVDTEALLAIMISQMLLSTPEEFVGDKRGMMPVMLEILAFYSYPNFELNKGKKITPWDITTCFELLEKYSYTRMTSKIFSEKKEDLDGVNNITHMLKMDSEIIRGTAYPEQTLKQIEEIQGKFDSWFLSRIGISPTRAISILALLIKHTEAAFNTNAEQFINAGHLYKNTYNEAKASAYKDLDAAKFLEHFQSSDDANSFGFLENICNVIPEILPIDLKDLPLEPAVTQQEAEGLIKLIGLTPEKYKVLISVIDVQALPLYVFSDNRVVLSEISNCCDFLWDSFETIAKSDKKFYDSRYQKFKGSWLEDETFRLFKRIFPAESIYQTLDYPNPDEGKSGTAELDLAIKWGPFLLLIEAKAKQFRFESLRGDSNKLRTDIKSNVEEAFEQSQRAKKYIVSQQTPVFVERASGKKLIIDKSEMLRIFPISVTLHDLAGLATQLHKTKAMGLFNENEYPFSISIADLDLITKTSIEPEVFLHYISKRLEIFKRKEEWHGDEIDLFGAYLDSRLLTNNFINKEDGYFDFISFGGYSDQFDRLQLYERGEIKESPDISLNIPTEIKPVFKELKIRKDNASIWILFNLLDVDNNLLSSLGLAIQEVNSAEIQPGIYRRVAIGNTNLVFSVTGSSSVSLPELVERTRLRCAIEKYKRKTTVSIGFGVLTYSPRLFETVQFHKSEWESDAIMEALVADEPPFFPISNSDIPQRNDKCFCGSGKKYKKCCLPKIEKTQREGFFRKQ